MSRRTTALIIAAGVAMLLVLLPKTKTATLDFHSMQTAGRWEVKNLTQVAPTQQGLHIKTDTSGSMATAIELPHRAQAVRITAITGRSTDAILYWHLRGTEDMIQYPFTIRHGDGPTITDLNVGVFSQWDPETDRIGLAFPAGAEVMLQEIQFVGWTPLGRVMEFFRSFWELDDLRAYSINFVWGPLLATTSVAREQLYWRQPPMAWSANTFFYVLLAGGMVALLVLQRKVGGKKLAQRAAVWFLGMLAAFWVLYDFRMGLEFINYVRTDLATYHANITPDRDFRGRGQFSDFAEEISRMIGGQARYVFMAEERWPYLGLLRYHTYPSIPTMPGVEDANLWVVYRRTDLVLDEKGQITMDGTVMSPPGKIVRTFGPGTFLFQTQP